MDYNSDGLPKAVVCHRGSRDYYQVSAALHLEGLLETLVTDFYFSPDFFPFSNELYRKNLKIFARSNKYLPAKMTTCNPSFILESALTRTPFDSKERQKRLDGSIGEKALGLAQKRNCAIFSYSYYAFQALADCPNRPRFRFLFQLHPHPATVRKILLEEMKNKPEFANSLKWENEIGSSEEHFQSLCLEPALANGWVVASTFTANSLVENGIPREKIHVVPYGVDFDAFPCRTNPPKTSSPFTIIWVGSMTQRKGLSYFLDAVSALNQDNLQVFIIGNSDIEAALIREKGIRSIKIFKGLPTSELTFKLRSADLFVLPSLAEGFGHSIIEALASGVPVLTTHSTCAPDIIENGRHGFIVPSRDAKALVDAISWARLNRNELYQMGINASRHVAQFTWDRFRRRIVDSYKKMVNDIRMEDPQK